MKTLIFAFCLLLCGNLQSAWMTDSYGRYHSNFCRAGMYWQIVPWNLAGTDCYMPGHGLWGKRVLE